MANVSQLQPALARQVQTSSVDALEKDADFLALRLINKRARLKLSPEPLDLSPFPGKVNLFAISNSKGWFAAVTRDVGGASVLVLSPLADLRAALASTSAEDEQAYIPQRRVLISAAPPHVLTFSCNDTRVLLGLLDGSILVYASDHLLSSGDDVVQPLHVFTASSSATLLSLQPNPGDIPDLVAVLRDCSNSPGSLAVELLDVQGLVSTGGWMAGRSPSTTPSSISWSPKGKQLALGLQSGDVVTFSPTATAAPKSSIPFPPGANNMTVISVHWLSTSSFHTIYAPLGQLTPDAEQFHFHASMDSKNNSVQNVKFSNPYLPFPGLRPPGEFVVCLRGWDPSKVLLFIGDSTSSDIGLIGSVATDSGEIWHNFTLEETSTPSLPLDKDQNDTILLGMGVDLTGSESYHHSTASGEALELPAHPIMYVYASDGTILGWHVLNVTGAPYPGMVTALNTSASVPPVPSVPSSMVRELSSDMQTTPTISPTSTQMEVSVAGPPSTVFSQPSTIGGQSSAFDASGPVFGQPPAFGQTQFGFGGQQPTSVFGKTSSFGQTATTSTFGSTSAPSHIMQSSTSAFGSTPVSGGFGAFSSTGPAKFGQTIFDQKSPFAKASAFTSTQQPFGSFGVSAFQTKPESAPSTTFGASSAFGSGLGSGQPFGQATSTPMFGQPSLNLKTSLETPLKSTDTSTTQLAFATTRDSGFPTAPQFSVRDSLARDVESRSPSPATAQQKSTSIPSNSTGAISNLQSTPSVFVKPASGIFGELPKESPFFTPRPAESKPASLFALSTTPGTTTTTPPKASTAAPAFGTPSLPGGAFKSAFPPATTSPAQPAPVLSSGAFGAFSSGGGGFGAFSSGGGGFAAFSSGGSKSFSDLLRSTGEDKPSAAEPPKPAKAPQLPMSTTPASTPAKEPLSTPPATPKLGKKEELETVEVKVDKVPVEPSHEKTTETLLIQDLSLESISSSTTSSFVKVSEDEHAEEDKTGEVDSDSLSEESEEGEEGEEDGDEEGYEEDASETPSEEADEEEAEEQVQNKTEPTEVPLPTTPIFTRSPSTTPKAEHPKIPLSVSPPPHTSSPSSVSRVSPVRDLVTTMPDVPVKDVPSTSVQIPVPPPKVSLPPSSPFVLAPRSNNRPIRSSPLASTPFIAEGETEILPPVSKSAPPTAQPAAPKEPFGQWTPTPQPPQSVEAEASRPKTPTFLSSFPEERSASAVFTPTTTPSAVPPSFVPADKAATTTIPPTTAPGPIFATSTGFSAFSPSTVSPSSWSSPKLSDVNLTQMKVPQTFFGEQTGMFGPKTTSAMPLSSSPSPFASPISATPSSTPPLPKVPARVPTPTPTPEQGMQAECTALLNTLDKEFKNLIQIATDASVKTEQLKKTSGLAHQKADLGDPDKWEFGDIEEYGRVLADVQADVKELKLQRVASRKELKELESNILKVNTRKEEIIRFNRAKTDAEYAKMLKVRTLAPEYSETQSQLRKSIRVIKDRVQKLEDHLQASKRRINELKTGRPSIRPPSLDTVNRTFRNIDITINQQQQGISQLWRRVAKLEIQGRVGAREQQAVALPKRPSTVTPNVALTTAATLNAERSAQRLKKALLASRTQPLLNTTATTSLVPTSFQTPQKPCSVKPEVKTTEADADADAAPERLIALPTTPMAMMMNFPSSLPSWTPPSPTEFPSPSLHHDISPSRNRGATKHHQKPIMLKKNVGPVAQGLAPPAPHLPPPLHPMTTTTTTATTTTQHPSAFEWKPVEPIRPASSLPFALRPAASS